MQSNIWLAPSQSMDKFIGNKYLVCKVEVLSADFEINTWFTINIWLAINSVLAMFYLRDIPGAVCQEFLKNFKTFLKQSKSELWGLSELQKSEEEYFYFSYSDILAWGITSEALSQFGTKLLM